MYKNDRKKITKNIVQVNLSTKLLLNKNNNDKTKSFFDEFLENIEPGNIYICSDKK